MASGRYNGVAVQDADCAIENSACESTGCDVSLNSFGISLKLKNNAQGKTEKVIIHPVDAKIQSGSLFAILGGSGSGKTTLLNVLADRFDKRHYEVTGDVHFSIPACRVGYVTQSDFLLPFLTVHETLLFTAKLKLVELPGHNSDYRKNTTTTGSSSSNHKAYYDNVVNQVILDLGLKECAHTRVGDDDIAVARRGISGGEKRRVSVGVQILTNPQVLCADEPTSGLDSFTAITVIECLQRLSQRRNTTVLCSIHQPRADIFHMFNDVLLLTKGGYTIYCGSTAKMVDYFNEIGYPCPTDANPADFFMDLSSVEVSNHLTFSSLEEKQQLKLQSLHRLRHLVQFYQAQHLAQKSRVGKTKTNSSDNDESIVVTGENQNAKYQRSIQKKNQRVAWMQQVSILFYRFLLNTLRDLSSVLGGLVQATILGLVLMGIFFQLGEDFAAVRSRTGLLYICVSLESYIMMLILVHKYISDVKILDRELQDDLYHPTAYFVAHFLSSVVPMLFVPVVLFCFPVYFGTGLRLYANRTPDDHNDNTEVTGDYFGTFVAVMLLLVLCINGLSWTGIAFSRLFPIASLISNMSFTFLSLSCGFLVNLTEMPDLIRWLKHVTFLSYGYRLLMINEFSDRVFLDCSVIVNNDCLAVQGNDLLPVYGILLDQKARFWPILVSIAIFYHLLPMLLLTILRFPPTLSASSNTGNAAMEGEEENSEDELELLVLLEYKAANVTSNTQGADEGVNQDIGDVQLTTVDNRSATSVFYVDSATEARFGHIDANEDNTVGADISTVVADITSSGSSTKNTTVHTTPSDASLSPDNSTKSNRLIRQISKKNSAGNSNEHEHKYRLWDISVKNVNLFATAPVSSSANKNYNATKNMSNSDRTNNSSGSDRKQLLHHIHAYIPAGQLVAVLGGSGSGKSTLLNLIANRIPQNVLNNNLTDKPNSANTSIKTSNKAHMNSVYSGDGLVLYNGQIPSAARVRSLIGYVQQNDYHLPSLTVQETLLFQAKLRLSISSNSNSHTNSFFCGFVDSCFGSQNKQTTDKRNRQRVNAVLQLLDLTRCRHVCVGNAEKKGISGGEKRRLSVAVQLLSDPSVCLFDEPTTGLDAFTARHVVQTLKQLATGSNNNMSKQSMYANTNVANNTTLDINKSRLEEDEEEGEEKEDKTEEAELNLMHRPRTVLLTIHQPRYDVFALFDHVLLLSRGHVLWCGPASQMLGHLSQLGYLCPVLSNPADFVLDMSSIDLRSVEQEKDTCARWQLLVTAYDNYVCVSSTGGQNNSSSSIEENKYCNVGATDSKAGSMVLVASSSSPNKRSYSKSYSYSSVDDNSSSESSAMVVVISNEKPFHHSFPLLLQRSFKNLYRQPELFTVRLTQTLFFGLILVLYYTPAKNTQQSIQNRVGNLYEFTALTFVGMLNCIAIFPIERNVFYREYVDGFYSSYAFIAAYFSLAAPLSLIASACFSVLMAFAIGLQPSFSAFVQFSYITWTFLMAGEALGVVFCTLFDEVGFSVNVVSVIISFFGVMAGFISPTMNEGLVYVSYLSPMRWGAYLLMHIAFGQETFMCPSFSVSLNDGTNNTNAPSISPNSTSNDNLPCLRTGEEVLVLYNFGDNNNFQHGRYGQVFHYYMSAIVVLIFVLISVASTRLRAKRLSH